MTNRLQNDFSLQPAAEQVLRLKHGTEMYENNLAVCVSPAITKSAIPLP